MNWETVVHKPQGQHFARLYLSGEEEWTIARSALEMDVVKISYKPRMPDGKTIMTIMDEMRMLRESMFDSALQRAKLHRYMSTHEIGYANSLYEAKLLIRLLIAGSGHLPPAEDTLRAAGFETAYALDDKDETVIYHHRVKKPLSVWLEKTGSIHATYDRTNGSWLNLMRLHKEEELVLYPEQAADPQRIGAAFMAKLIGMRTERGGQFRKPIDETVEA